MSTLTPIDGTADVDQTYDTLTKYLDDGYELFVEVLTNKVIYYAKHPVSKTYFEIKIADSEEYKVSMPPWLTYAPCKDIEVTKKISVFPLVRKEPSEVGEPIQRYPQ